eukprot:jgi/Hompol1/3921/HPOL_000718-RA
MTSIPILDMPFELFETFLRFVYSGILNVPRSAMAFAQLIILAERFGHHDLQLACSRELYALIQDIDAALEIADAYADTSEVILVTVTRIIFLHLQLIESAIKPDNVMSFLFSIGYRHAVFKRIALEFLWLHISHVRESHDFAMVLLNPSGYQSGQYSGIVREMFDHLISRQPDIDIDPHAIQLMNSSCLDHTCQIRVLLPCLNAVSVTPSGHRRFERVFAIVDDFCMEDDSAFDTVIPEEPITTKDDANVSSTLAPVTTDSTGLSACNDSRDHAKSARKLPMEEDQDQPGKVKLRLRLNSDSVFSQLVTSATRTTFCADGLMVWSAGTVFVAILDLDAPVTSCAATNAVSYTFIVIMRLSIMVGLASRALGANRQLKIVALNVGVGISIAIGLASIGLLLWIAFTTKLIKSNDNVDFCLQDLPHIPVIVNNVMFLFSGSCLTFLMAYPIQKSLTAAAVQHAALRQISSANPLPLTKTHNQARVMLKLARIIPIVMPTALFIVSMISHLTNLPSVFYATLVFSDFAGMLLLLFPIIVLSGDNGEAIAAARYVKSKVPLGETRPQAYSAPSSVAANTTFNATTADTSMTEAPSSSGTVTEGLSQGLRASRGPGATTMMINGRPVVR